MGNDEIIETCECWLTLMTYLLKDNFQGANNPPQFMKLISITFC